MPLEEEGLPLPEIYGSVLIEEDLSAVQKTRRQDQPEGRKTLDCIRDMFFVKDKLTNIIILSGEAGHGKTVFSLKLIDSWSRAKRFGRETDGKENRGAVEKKISDKLNKETQRAGSEQVVGKRGGGARRHRAKLEHQQLPVAKIQRENEDRDLQETLSLFDLAFYVPLRHAKHGTSSIVDLVCGSVAECDQATKQKIRQMIDDSNIKCLVILDGLDEYKVPDTCRIRGFPDNDGLVNCVVLCTMRPWRMVDLRLGLDYKRDKVVQILGLKSESIELVISNVLVHFYGLKIGTPLYKEKFKHFCAKAKHGWLESLVKIPMLLTASCLVWNEEGEASDERYITRGKYYYMTLFHLKLMNITITRTENKHDIVRFFLCEKRQPAVKSMHVLNILSEFQAINDFLTIILPVGKLALQDLMSEEPHLIFPKDKLERDIGQSNVELALKVGILSQTKAPGLSYQQRISLSFYHKSIQEFIAALYITCGGTEALNSFRIHCSTVDKVMELSDVIKFVCGLDTLIGCQLSGHVKNVVNRDTDIIQYRESGHAEYEKRKIEHFDMNKVSELYEMQCEWYSEMKQNLSYTHNTDNKPTPHVTDVYLLSIRDDVSEASELVSMEGNSIVSVYLRDIEHPINSIIQNLPGCTNLTSLYIWGITKTQDVELLVEVLPQLVQLQYVGYGYYIDGKGPRNDTAVVRAAHNILALRCLQLVGITLNDAVALPPFIKTVELHRVKSAHFILPSLCQCSHLTCIKLQDIALTETVTLPSQLQKLKLYDVKPAQVILASLLGCPKLTALDITLRLGYEKKKEECEVLASVLPQLHHLEYIHFDGMFCICEYDIHTAVVSALQNLKQLTHIELECIAPYYTTLLVKSHMKQLQKVDLRVIEMSKKKWTEFVSSLLSVQQSVHVTLAINGIARATFDTIFNSPNFTVTKDEWDNEFWLLEFHTVQKLTTVDLPTRDNCDWSPSSTLEVTDID